MLERLGKTASQLTPPLTSLHLSWRNHAQYDSDAETPVTVADCRDPQKNCSPVIPMTLMLSNEWSPTMVGTSRQTDGEKGLSSQGG